MLSGVISAQVLLGFAQAVASALLCLGVVFLCRRYEVYVARETLISLARGFVQMALVGVLLGALLKSSSLVASLILLGMMYVASRTAAKRLPELHGATLLAFPAIAAGSGLAIFFMIATRALPTDLSILIPVGSMIVANCMNACAQAMERYRSDVFAHVGQIEAALSLGASAETTVTPFVQTSVYASLLPRLDMLKSLGLVWIPGVMAGMMVSGASPLYAGVYQFVIVAMILAASGISGVIVIVLLRRQSFSKAQQLALRPVSAGRGPSSDKG